MKTLNNTINDFVVGFESQFKGVLRPAVRVATLPGRTPPITTNHFVIYIGETKFSDWDLHCCANSGKITLSDLNSMNRFVMEFQGFECTGNFDGNKMPQFMAFTPNESFAPFVDIHIESITAEMTEQYFSGFFRDTLRDETNSWLLLTWWRKLKKGNQQDSDGFRDCWIIPPRFRSDGRIGKDPASFLIEYFGSKTDYAKAMDYLSRA